MDRPLDRLSPSLAPQLWIERYVHRFVELSAASGARAPMPEPQLRAFATSCARCGYPAFHADDPGECAEAEFLDWQDGLV